MSVGDSLFWQIYNSADDLANSSDGDIGWIRDQISNLLDWFNHWETSAYDYLMSWQNNAPWPFSVAIGWIVSLVWSNAVVRAFDVPRRSLQLSDDILGALWRGGWNHYLPGLWIIQLALPIASRVRDAANYSETAAVWAITQAQEHIDVASADLRAWFTGVNSQIGGWVNQRFDDFGRWVSDGENSLGNALRGLINDANTFTQDVRNWAQDEINNQHSWVTGHLGDLQTSWDSLSTYAQEIRNDLDVIRSDPPGWILSHISTPFVDWLEARLTERW